MAIRVAGWWGRGIGGWAGCLVVLFIVSFWRLGDASFWDPDEAHYAQTTRELIASGDWLAPSFNDEPFFDKPIFFHWLQSLPMRVLGPTPGAARAIPACATVVLVWTTWWVATRFRDRDAGVLAALLLACNPGIFALARYAILDSVMTAFLFGAVSCLAVRANGGGETLEVVGYVLLGLATCIKGPVAVILAGVAMLLAMLVSAEARQRLRTLHVWRGLALVAAIAAPWFAYMVWRFGDAFIQGYILDENLRLFARERFANQPAWWFYIVVVATGLLPWTWLIAGRAIDQIRASWRREAPVEFFDVLLWSWSAAIVGFFSLSRFKLDHYVFPVAPALCLLAARAWSDARGGGWLQRATRQSVRLIGPTLAIAGAALSAVAVAVLALPPAFLAVPIAVTALGVAATLRYSGQSRILPRMPSLAIVSVAFVYLGVVSWVIPELEQKKAIPEVARWVALHAAPDVRVATYRLNRWNPAYRFYVDRHVSILDSDDDVRQFLADASHYFCVMTEPAYQSLSNAGVPLKVVYRREGLWATSGSALWRRGGQQTTFVVATHPSHEVGP